MEDFFRFSNFFGFWVFLVHPTVVSVLLSASVERCFVSRMRDFYKDNFDCLRTIMTIATTTKMLLSISCCSFIFLRSSSCLLLLLLLVVILEKPAGLLHGGLLASLISIWLCCCNCPDSPRGVRSLPWLPVPKGATVGPSRGTIGSTTMGHCVLAHSFVL